ncbi:MAG TPA: hypothetical protein VEX39_14590 [Thermoleophilaceae bacterium]|nr:hypothetical protein [Thermoleophilaceae bacterium]
MASELRHMDVGFQGGPVLAVKATTESYEKLVKALDDNSGARWQTVQTEDSEILIDLSQVVYVRRESGDQKVGF